MSLWTKLRDALGGIPDDDAVAPPTPTPPASAPAPVPPNPAAIHRASRGRMAGAEYRDLMRAGTLPQREERQLVTGSEIRLVRSGGKALIRGYAVVWNSKSRVLGWFRELFLPGAFRDQLAGAPDILALNQHLMHEPLARTTAGNLELGEDEKGLWYEMNASDTSYARDLVKLLDDKVVHQSSFLFLTPRDGDRWSIDEDGMDLRTVIRAELLEISPVSMPAYIETSAGTRKADPSSEVPPYDAVKAKELAELLASL